MMADTPVLTLLDLSALSGEAGQYETMGPDLADFDCWVLCIKLCIKGSESLVLD
jgi:hypothetical protein